MDASGIELLSARERDVLRLIALGLTNSEIAARLDIRFDIAKWHVSEILSKLGVDSREEAAVRWQEWQSVPARARRLTRGLVPVGLAARVAISTLVASAAITAIAVILVAILGESGSDGAIVPGSFHLEAYYFDRRETVGTQLQEKEAAAQGGISWWQRDSLRFRIETTDTSVNLPNRGGTILSDGTSVFNQDALMQSNHTQMLLENMPGGFWGGMSPGLLFYVGPLRERSVEELVAWLKRPTQPPARHAVRAGEELVAGRRTEVVIYGPTWVDAERGTFGGIGMMWVDPETMFILRRTEEGADGSAARHYEVTSLELGLRIPDSRFNRPRR